MRRKNPRQKKSSSILPSQEQTLYTPKQDQKSPTKQTTLKITIPENSPAHSIGAATPQFQISPAAGAPKDNGGTFNRGFSRAVGGQSIDSKGAGSMVNYGQLPTQSAFTYGGGNETDAEEETHPISEVEETEYGHK